MSLRNPVRLAIVVGAVALAVAAAGWFLLVSSQRSEAARLQDDLDAAYASLAQKRAEVKEARGIAGAAPPEVLRTALPDDAPIADVITELSQMADASGVTFAAVTPGAPVATEGFTVTPLDVQVQGNWGGISAFVSKARRLVSFADGQLRASGRLYSVRTLDLTEGEAKFPNLNAALTLDVFHYGTAPGATAAPAAS